jgi:glycosyltransferase involved in cell wall biosynthesis
MRILIPNHFPIEGSGSGIYTQNAALELTRLGNSVCVIAPDHRQRTGYPYEIRNIIFSNGENEDPDLPFNFPCFTTHPVSNTTFYSLTDQERRQYVETYRAFVDRAVEEFSPDIIHVQHLWVATYCASLTGIPYIATVHGTDLMGYEKDQRYHAYAEQGAAGAERLISISGQITEKTLALYDVPEQKIETILNGFSTDIFKPLGTEKQEIFDAYGIPETDYLVSFVGKLTDFKGVDILIKAAAAYEKELGSVTTIITGMGALKQELDGLVAELGLRHVHFIGHQPQQAVAKINSAADLATFPSRVEPFGLVAIEALACGTPVVTTNQGGFPDFINEQVGALVDVDSPGQLAEAIMHEIRSNAKEKKGPYAAQYAADGFSWKKKVKQFFELYRDVVGRQ